MRPDAWLAVPALLLVLGVRGAFGRLRVLVRRLRRLLRG